MKGMVLTAITALLLATAAAKAGPAMIVGGARIAPSLVEMAQFKNQGQGEGFKKRGWIKPKSSAECYQRCIGAGKKEVACARRCKNPSAKSLTHRDR